MNTAMVHPPRSAASTPALTLSCLLEELGAAILELPADVYRAQLAHGVSGSIGEHMRHCLDHVSALVSTSGTGSLSYDHRRRGTTVETEPSAALRQILNLQAVLQTWPSGSLDEPVHVTSMISSAGEVVAGWSTLARELAFVVSHTIHHRAIIGLLLSMHGYAVADRFGYAPSTPSRR